ncbi:conserved hypothetical protein [Neospora caninum Liverpool]|uniref:Mic1 domain-containing protein n=1 Tax=Neospora caninum (strain Liverpool) TaxID=572307 RepID=F0VMR3_NEOCL|nr:conserved hypothetical protein [Neospora caninum Liverpool]CBZ55009.1 conserved hypothetical protein [Neospora caninum Liverpool]CEL69734.1 TPA: hypothetical protein BN1204_054360 [Neospora caninum Liverpool]|eukprot:XP_003885037.1 conserved hypothetical protein [Neospora caninum Liverpool]
MPDPSLCSMASAEATLSGASPSRTRAGAFPSFSWENYTDSAGSGQCRAEISRPPDSSGTGIGHLEYTAHKPPPPLTEAELRYYAALPPVYLQPPIYSWTSSARARTSPQPFIQQRVLFDEVHRKIIHQRIGCPPSALPGTLGTQLGKLELQASPLSTGSDPDLQALSGQTLSFHRSTAQSPASALGGAHTPQLHGNGSCSFLLCVDTREKQRSRGHKQSASASGSSKDEEGKDVVISFNKGLASILRFSPCGRYLLYVAPPAQPSLPSSGSGSPRVPPSPRGGGGRGEATGGAAASASEAMPEGGTATLQEEVEIGIVDTVAPQAGPVVLLPVEGTVGGERGKDGAHAGGILQAFWLPSLVPAETEANICVITRQGVEIFTFVFEPPSVRQVRRLPQPCNLAWAVLCPFPSTPSTTMSSRAPSVFSRSPSTASRARGPTRPSVLAAGERRPAVAGAFVLAVAARALQPFLLKWNENGVPGVTLAKLPKIELNLPQWQTLQQQEVHFLLVYGVVYCIHVDQAAGRISMRTLTGHLQPDIVLDCLQPGPMEVSVVDDLILVHHQRLRSTLIYDIYDYPALPTAPFSVSLSSSLSSAAAAKTVRAVTPLVHHSVAGTRPSPSFEESAGRDEDEAGRSASLSKRSVSQQLDDVELQTVDFDTARFVGGEFVMDEEGGHMYILALNHDVLMHLLLLERQSLSFALQVMQQRSGCRRHVLRLLQHALRLRTPLSDLSPVLMLVNQRYRSAVESVPDEFLLTGKRRDPNEPDADGTSKERGSGLRAGGKEEAGKSPKDAGHSDRARLVGSGEVKAKAQAAEHAKTGATENRGRKQEEEGRTRVAFERLIAWVGDATIVTERDVVLSAFYPYVVETLDLPPGQLLLEAAFDLPPGTASSLSSSLCRKIPSHSLPASPLAAPCGCPGQFCGAITRSPAGKDGVGWRRGDPRSGSWESEGPSASPPPTAVGGEGGTEVSGDGSGFFGGGQLSSYSSEIPYVLSAALEYMRLLLGQQVLPHRVLQTFIFDACVFYKRGDILRQLLQYHVLLDSPGMLKRLYIVWQQLRMRRRCLASAIDERWTRQTCLDMALRQRDWGTIVEILIELKQYTRVVPLLQRYAVSYYPLRDFLRAVAADVEAQESQPGLLQHILACVRAWVNEATVSASGLALPNLTDCSLWLPHDLTAAAAPKQLPALLHEFSEKQLSNSSVDTAELSRRDSAASRGDERDDEPGEAGAQRQTLESEGEAAAEEAKKREPVEERKANGGVDRRDATGKDEKRSGGHRVRLDGEAGNGNSEAGSEEEERRRQELEAHVVDWEEIGEISAALVEESEISDSEQSADTMFSFEAHHHLVVASLGESHLDEARTTHFSA